MTNNKNQSRCRDFFYWGMGTPHMLWDDYCVVNFFLRPPLRQQENPIVHKERETFNTLIQHPQNVAINYI